MGYALKHAASEHEAVKQNGNACEQAATHGNGPGICGTPSSVRCRVLLLEAAKQNANPRRHAVPEHKADRESMLEAVKRNGCVLKHAAPEQHADRECILEVVRHNGCALERAAPDEQADREGMLEVVELHGYAPQHTVPVLFRHTAFEHKADCGVPSAERRALTPYRLQEQKDFF